MCAQFDGGQLYFDGGVLLLRGTERGLGLAAVLASCMKDERKPSSTTFSLVDTIRARMFAIPCGYEDYDDLDLIIFTTSSSAMCLVIASTNGSEPMPGIKWADF